MSDFLNSVKEFIKNFHSDIAVDLGTANTVVFAKNHGIQVNEPSVVSVLNEYGNKTVRAIGSDAKEMISKSPRGIEVIKPLRNGVICDDEVAAKMLQLYMGRVHEASFFKPNPRVVLSIPTGATQVERRIAKEVAIKAGAKEVHLVDEVCCAAVGANLPISSATGNMIVDIGGGTTEIAVIASNGIVASQSLKSAGDRMDECIIGYLKDKHKIRIGLNTAEKTKINLGCAFFDNKMQRSETTCIQGFDIFSSQPHKINVSRYEIFEAISPVLEDILKGIKQTLEDTPSDYVNDLCQNGITLVGGGSQIMNLTKLIENHCGIESRIAKDPLLCVANGGGKILDYIGTSKEFDFH